MNHSYKQEIWLETALAKNLESFEYWNNEEAEKNKEWYVLDGDFIKMEEYIKKCGLEDQLRSCFKLLTANNLKLKGSGIELAAGNLWSVPYLFKYAEIGKLYCLEFSAHRLLKIGPMVLNHYEIPAEKVVLALGSFYEIKLPAASLDFVFLSQAFHHAEDPNKLLAEIKRVLKPGGIVLMIGEHPTKINYFKNILKYMITKWIPASLQKKLFGKLFNTQIFIPKKASDILPPDPETGDHYYTYAEYMAMFKQQHFQILSVRNQMACSFVLINKG